ncbi:MAG: hypothetical protein IJA49_08280, partial [Oscillospiraceae bacterium]|nr:hypothetical protein [Oscillospiraceae bacterium]
VTLFAERGSGYGDSVAVGGIIARFDPDTPQSAWTPYTVLTAAQFDSGTFAGVYSIPDESLHRQFKGDYNAKDPASITNRLYTETVAGNFDNNEAGQEQLAFTYTAKKTGESEYYAAYGIIGQKEPGDLDNVGNTDERGDKFLADGITYRAWVPSTGQTRAALTVGAVDPDDDSLLMRHSGKPNEYYFSDPEIIAVLQTAPFFADLPYQETGETSLEITESHIQDKANGVSASVSVQVGKDFGAVKVLGGIYAETSKVWGEVWTKTTSVGYTALDTNSVALVMTPYVRYHYEVYSPETDSWDPITVNVPQLPRPTMVSVAEYDEMAAIEGWPQIMGNILNNVEGYPSTYDTDLSGKKNFLGGDVPGDVTEKKGDDFIRVGSGGSGDISQTIGRGYESYSDFSWGVGAAESLTYEGGFVLDQSASIGYTGSYTKSRFDGDDFTGKVSSIPAGYPEYTFLWRFCTWEETMNINGKNQTFRVLGYMVKNVENPPLQGNYLHVVNEDTNSVTLSWRGALQELNRDGLPVNSQGYGLYRERNGIYYPLVNLGHSEAEHNWFTFTDEYVDPFTQYNYVIRSYAFYNHQLMYGTYSDPVTAYTAPDFENLPSVYVVDSGESGGTRTLTAYVTSAIGNVGSLMVQWQVYDRTGGGWVNCKIADRQSANGDTLLSLLTLDGADTQKQYRCQVTQRVDNEIYTIYSGDRKGGYVYVAAKASVTVNGERLTRYILVNENGTVETVDSANSRYNTKYVYLRDKDENGDLLLTTNEYTKQQRSVTLVEDDIVEVNGGLSYASDGGGDFIVMEASQVWDVTTYNNPKRDTLEKNNLISYVVNPDGTLRAAFINGTRNWSPPSYDDGESSSLPACPCCEGAFQDEETGEWVSPCSDVPDCPANHACCINPDYEYYA